MEFFEYLRIPQYLVEYFRGGGISVSELYLIMAVAGGAYLICLLLGGLALYVMAERAGLKHSWLGFLPFANTYYAGKVAGELSFFGKKMKRAGLYAMLAEIAYAIVTILELVANVLLSNPAYYETSFVSGSANGTLIFNAQSVPAGLRWMADGAMWFSILGVVFYLAMLVFICVLYNALFRKYSPKNAYVLTVVSVLLPVRAFVLFAVRNNPCVDYNEYMKQRLEQMLGRSVAEEPPQDEPFSDFSDGKAGSSPFADFTGNTSNASPFSEFDDTPTPQAPDSDGSEQDRGDK